MFSRERPAKETSEEANPFLSPSAGVWPRLPQPGTELTGGTNDPSDLNERVVNVDALMVAEQPSQKLTS